MNTQFNTNADIAKDAPEARDYIYLDIYYEKVNLIERTLRNYNSNTEEGQEIVKLVFENIDSIFMFSVLLVAEKSNKDVMATLRETEEVQSAICAAASFLTEKQLKERG